VDTAPGPLRRSLRRFLVGSGPLKRTSDRVEALGRVLAVALVLLAVPVALALATVTRSDLTAAAARQAAQLHQVVGVTREAAGWPDQGVAGRVDVRAVVPGPDGLRREVNVLVDRGTTADTPVPVWLADDGTVAAPPARPSAIATEAVFVAVVVVLGALLTAVGGQVLLRRLLDRRRARRWDAGWALVEPEWSRRVP
jgi:hypothetical protein